MDLYVALAPHNPTLLDGRPRHDLSPSLSGSGDHCTDIVNIRRLCPLSTASKSAPVTESQIRTALSCKRHWEPSPDQGTTPLGKRNPCVLSQLPQYARRWPGPRSAYTFPWTPPCGDPYSIGHEDLYPLLNYVFLYKYSIKRGCAIAPSFRPRLRNRPYSTCFSTFFSYYTFLNISLKRCFS